MAQAGQAMNQTSCAGSPQPHVRRGRRVARPDVPPQRDGGNGEEDDGDEVEPDGAAGPCPCGSAGRGVGLESVGDGRRHDVAGSPGRRRIRTGRACRAWGASTRPSRSSLALSVPPTLLAAGAETGRTAFL